MSRDTIDLIHEVAPRVAGAGWAIIVINFLVGLGNKATESTREASNETYGFDTPAMDFFIPPIIGVIVIVASLVLLAIAFIGDQQRKQQEARAAAPNAVAAPRGKVTTPSPTRTPAPAPNPNPGTQSSFMDKLGSPQVQALIGIGGLMLGILQLALSAA